MTNQNQAGVLQIRRMKNRTRFSVFQNLGFPSSLAALLAFPKMNKKKICNRALQKILHSIPNMYNSDGNIKFENYLYRQQYSTDMSSQNLQDYYEG